jgi:hypothetical protein
VARSVDDLISFHVVVLSRCENVVSSATMIPFELALSRELWKDCGNNCKALVARGLVRWSILGYWWTVGIVAITTLVTRVTNRKRGIGRQSGLYGPVSACMPTVLRYGRWTGVRYTGVNWCTGVRCTGVRYTFVNCTCVRYTGVSVVKLIWWTLGKLVWDNCNALSLLRHGCVRKY